MSDNDPAIACLQALSLLAAKALHGSFDSSVLLVATRDAIPQGDRFHLIPGMKSPMGELLSVKPNGERFDCCGRFSAEDVLASCMAKLDELGASCPVVVRGPNGKSIRSKVKYEGNL